MPVTLLWSGGVAGIESVLEPELYPMSFPGKEIWVTFGLFMVRIGV